MLGVRRAMTVTQKARGADLNRRWNVGAAHALYIHDGHWYHQLRRFPGALFDRNGYILVPTKEDYLACTHLSIGKQISVAPPGISAIPGYVRVTEAAAPDVDVHAATGMEGQRKLILHLTRERDRALVKLKKAAGSRSCEACGFSFRRTYGRMAASYCEVHHLVPLSDLSETTEMHLDDLAILCANCHRVVHLRNPPYTLEEVREMLRESADAQQAVPGDGLRAAPLARA